FLLVRWGKRRYLVPTEQVLDFCGDIQSRREPRNETRGFYYLRRGDEKKPATGKPELPLGFEKYLAMQPIEAKLTATGPETATKSKEGFGLEDVSRRVTINAGSA